MRNFLNLFSIILLLATTVFFLNLNSSEITESDISLTGLVTINIANAEQTLTCYGTYQLGGEFVINRCYDCKQVSRVQSYIAGTKSTCVIP